MKSRYSFHQRFRGDSPQNRDYTRFLNRSYDGFGKHDLFLSVIGYPLGFFLVPELCTLYRFKLDLRCQSGMRKKLLHNSRVRF
jgi:hypothetical protein